MTKQIQANHMNMKSVRKFWQFTLLFFLALIVFNELLSKLYESIRKALLLNDVGVFLILAVLFALLFWELIGKIKDNKQVSWKLRDTFIVAVMIKSLWLIIWAFITLSFVPLNYFNFIDFSIYQWISSGTFENVHLILAFVYFAGAYLAFKYYHWDSMASKLNRIKKSTEVGFELNDDRTLGETEAFQNCKTLAELKELDKLGRFDYAQQISHIIINNGEKKSFAIGINGEWGSGKTSFIDMIKRINEIEYSDQCIFINFNPWYFTGTEKVLKKFYDTLIKAVGNNFSITFRNDLTRYFELICATETKIWKTNFLQYFKKNTDFDSQLDDLKKHFNGLPQKIVIVIDDLDRLQKDEILVLFRTIRLIGDFPNVVYLVGYSHDYVSRILEENKETADEQASFMEKIFQLEFELPGPLKSDVLDYCKLQFQKYIPDYLEEEEGILKEIVENRILSNVRDIKRFYNQLEINSSLPEIRENTYLPQFFLLELIYYTDSNMYFKIWHNESLLSQEDKRKSTNLLIDLILKLGSRSNQSITKSKSHFNKYFFKRLDLKQEVDYRQVKLVFESDKFENIIKELYKINLNQLIDGFIKFSKDETTNSLNTYSILDRILFLYEYIFVNKEWDTKYFMKSKAFEGSSLIKCINDNIIKPNEHNQIEEYLISKKEYKSFSDFLRMFYSYNTSLNLKELHKKAVNEGFIQAVNEIDSLLISLNNYQKYCDANRNQFYESIFEDNSIKEGLRQHAKLIYNKLTKLKQSSKGDYSILSFFGDRDNLLQINDYSSEGIFNLLDEYSEKYYPVFESNLLNIFNYEFERDNYKYRIRIPRDLNQIKILTTNNEEICGVRATNNELIPWTGNSKSGSLMNNTFFFPSRTSLNNLFIVFYRSETGTSYCIQRENDDKEVIKATQINILRDISFKIRIETENNYEFLLERKLLPSQFQLRTNSISVADLLQKSKVR
ncbi:hypothetical protein GCQ56_08350 [Marinifilum sp. N1E240]|uniref:KAP family P-loop NTPase fold protein n=1 Tax=Marinifilum sp. N1E240 TaxID=2608082 RepID=UPI00128D2CCA|nr:P-loop NTPase fold protein [Marinifilum sp. N1E240]MPQ47024.1 hypothetical protein [Marinifilum sp. N1E240]